MTLEDAAEQLRDKRAELDFSPEEYDALEERLSRLRRLEKKYAAAGQYAIDTLTVPSEEERIKLVTNYNPKETSA